MARQFTKGIDLYKAQGDFFQRAQLSAEKAHAQLAEQAYEDWKALVSGQLQKAQTKGAFARGSNVTVSTKFGRRRQLTAAQLAKRNLSGSVPLLPINIQSGRLERSITRRQTGTMPRQIFDVGPNSSAGKSMWVLVPGGTRKMIARGIWVEIERRWKARNKAFQDMYVKGQGV